MLSYNEMCCIEQVQYNAKAALATFAGSSDKRRLNAACDIITLVRQMYFAVDNTASTEKDIAEAKEKFIRDILSLI